MLAEARLRLAEVASTSYAAQTVQRRLAGWGRRCVGARPPSPRQRQRRAAVLVRSSAADDFGERIRKWARGQMQQGRQGQRQGQQPEDGGGGAPTISSGDGMGASMSAGSGGAAGSDSGRQRSVWTDWSGQDEDWDEWKSQVVVDLEDVEELAELREAVIERRRQRRGKRSNVRDEYLRPIVDPQGIYNRLAYDEKEVEERVFIEAITNQYESREALKYGSIPPHISAQNHAVCSYAEFAEENAELLRGIPPPLVALNYYKSGDLYLFDQFQTSYKGKEPRRPPCNNLYDVFCAIRDDEVEHVKTMQACQNNTIRLDLQNEAAMRQVAEQQQVAKLPASSEEDEQ